MRRGFALVIVTGIITFLGILVSNNSIEIGISKGWLESEKMKRKAYYLALAGMEAARALIKNDTEEDNSQGKRLDFITPELDPNEEVWSHANEIVIPISASDGIEGIVSGMIVDEASKLNINILIETSGSPPRIPEGMNEHPRTSLIKRFFENSGVDPSLVDNIMDWIDKDDDGSAETSYYSLLPSPYEAKNAPLDTISELMLIKGIDDNTYMKLTGTGTEAWKRDPLSSPFLTVYPQIQKEGLQKININTAPAEVLMALNPGIDERVAKEILAERYNKPFQSTGEFLKYLERIINIDEKEKSFLREILDVKSNCFSVKVTGIVGNFQTTIRAVFWRDSAGNTETLYWRVD